MTHTSADPRRPSPLDPLPCESPCEKAASDGAAARPIRVLLIEDSLGDAGLVQWMLSSSQGSRFQLTHVGTLEEGLGKLAETDVVLLDLGLPDSQGLDTVVKVHSRAPQIPIVVLSSLEDEELAVRAIHHGAEDYLLKSDLDSTLLVRSIRHAITRACMERNVQSQHGLNQALLEALSEAGEGLAIVDASSQRFLYVNDAACRMSGYSRDELLALPSFFGLVVPDERPALEDATRRRFAGEAVPDRYEATALTRDGHRLTVEVTVKPHPSDGLNQVIVFIRDITEQRRSERELKKARDEALEASRLKSAFLANMSHEIRTPLNILLGYSSLVEEHLQDRRDDSQSELFAAIRRAGRRLMATVHHVLDLSKIETRNFSIEPTRLLVASIVEREVADARKAAEEKGLSLRCRIDAPDAEVLFDEYCLSRSIGELLENAIKFTQRGEVSARLHCNGSGLLRLEIRDTGVGIDEAFLPRIFEPFSQEEYGYTRQFEGSGLGLALVRKYLELNGARVSIESEKGTGSTFTIEFARTSESAERPKSAEPQSARPETMVAAAPAPDKPFVLVVEDDPDTQALMKTMLGRGYDVRAAASAEEAWRELEAHPRENTVILMDLSLKGCEDGVNLTRALRKQERWKDVPIIATTAHALPEDRQRAMAAGCNGYLAKPFGREELLSMMTRVSGLRFQKSS